MHVKKDYVWNPSTCNCENKKYLAIIMMIQQLCVMKLQSHATKKHFNEKKATCKTQNFCILLGFLLFNIALLTAVSIYYSLIKCRAIIKYLLPFHCANNKFKIQIKNE